jgi:muramoyltetrapeptide carboxypeptidase
MALMIGSSKAPSIVTPPALQPGGRIGIVALASPVPPDRLERGEGALRSMGFEVVRGEHVLEGMGHHAGEPAARAADLHAMFTRPDIDAIFCARGGSSSIRVLEHLDFDLIRAHPKVFVGYSDVTSVMLAMLARSGLRTFFGPMVTPDWAGDLSLGARDALWRLVCRTRPAGPLTDRRCTTEAAPLVGGRARGVLVGGTLALITATLGTPEQIDLTDGIFFFEDVNESPARIERYLAQLHRAGLLQQAAGFLVGPLRWEAPDEERERFLSLEAVLGDLLLPLGRPTLIRYPCGHVPSPITLPLGALVELNADQRVVSVLEAAVR